MIPRPLLDILMSLWWLLHGTPRACFGGHKLFMYVMHRIRMSNLCWQMWFGLIFVWGTRGGRLINLLQLSLSLFKSPMPDDAVYVLAEARGVCRHAVGMYWIYALGLCVLTSPQAGMIHWYVLILRSLTDASRGNTRIGCDTRGHSFSPRSH